MANFIMRWALNIITLFLVINIVAGVNVDSWQAIVVAAFILGLLNTFLKPIIVLFTLPFNVLTLGIFTLFINAGMFYLATKFVKGFHVMSFATAFWAALIFSVISFILNLAFAPKVTFTARQTGYTRPPDDDARNRFDNVIDVEGEVQEEEREEE